MCVGIEECKRLCDSEHKHQFTYHITKAKQGVRSICAMVRRRFAKSLPQDDCGKSNCKTSAKHAASCKCWLKFPKCKLPPMFVFPFICRLVSRKPHHLSRKVTINHATKILSKDCEECNKLRREKDILSLCLWFWNSSCRCTWSTLASLHSRYWELINDSRWKLCQLIDGVPIILSSIFLYLNLFM